MDLTQPFQLAFFLITIFTLLLQFYVLYVIKSASPRSMKDYKLYLVINTIFEICFVVNHGLFYMQEPPEFYPGAGAFVRGFSAYFGTIGINIAGTGMYFWGATMLGSQDICLLYRLFAVIPNKEYYKKFTSLRCTVAMYSVILAVSFALALGLLPAIASKSEYKEVIDTWTAGQTIEIDWDTPRFLLLNNRPYMKNYFNIAAACLATSEIVYFAIVFLILFILKRDSDKFSRRSLRLHRQLTVLLAVQILVPLLMFIMPYVSVLFQMNRRRVNKRELSVVGMLFFASHSFMMSLLTILLITPYRKFVVGRFKNLAHPSKIFTKVTVPTKTGISTSAY